MGFIEEFKRLDNLCKDLLRSDKGVSSYIDSMKQYEGIHNRVQNWDYDYKQLKHYRHIRNQIAHDNYANENNMSNEHDVEWIKNFYQRILNQTDPLALYHKKTNAVQHSVKIINKPETVYKQINNNDKDNTFNSIDIIITVIVVCVIISLFVLFIR